MIAELAGRGVHVRGPALALAPGGDELRRGKEPVVLAGGERSRRSGAARPPRPPRRQPPPEARRRAALRSRRATSRSSAGSTSVTADVTTPGTSATRRPWSSTTSTTATGRRGTTCSSSCTARPSTTWRTRSPSAGTIPRRSTPQSGAGRTPPGRPPSRRSPDRSHPARPAPGDGPLAVQVLRTYPARRRPYPFAPEGERSIARAYLKAFARARRLIYVEDQYLWSIDATRALRDVVGRAPRPPRSSR